MKLTIKLSAILMSIIIAFGFVPSAGAQISGAAETFSADKKEKIEELLTFSKRVNEMTKRYSAASAPGNFQLKTSNDLFATARLIVKCPGDADYTGSAAHVSGHNDLHIIQYGTPDEARSAAEAFSKTKGVEYAVPDAIVHIAQEPHENSFLSWGYTADHINTNDYTEWLLRDCGDSVSNLPEIIVAVIDTGIDFNHPYFKGRIADGGRNFIDNSDNPADDQGHGSHVAGTICDGTLPNVKILPIKVLGSDGSGTIMSVAAGMEYAYIMGADVVNMSLGGLTAGNDKTYENIINAGADSPSKTVYCVAAGNDGEDAGGYSPANVERACTVAAHDSNKNMAPFSNFGDAVDITAPGVNINSVHLGGGYVTMDGTSMACPHVAAACALIKSYNREMPADDVINALKNNASPAGFTNGGSGLLCVEGLLKIDPYLNGSGTSIHYFTGGEYPWEANEHGAYSTNAGHNNSLSVLSSYTLFKAYSKISFEYNVSSETGSDIFKFCVDGEAILSKSGDTGWKTFEYVFPTGGLKTLTWEFLKDAENAAGQDKAMLRGIVVSDTISSVLNTGESDFVFSGDWILDNDSAVSGNAGSDDTVSELKTAPKQIEADLTLIFKYKVSCGAGDRFQFLVNDDIILEANTETDWTEFRYKVENSGSYVFAFRYVKDGTGAAGNDCARIKQVDIRLTLDTVLNTEGGKLVFDSEGRYPWIVAENHAKSGNGGMGGSNSVLSLKIHLNEGDILAFRYTVSSEPQCDWFKFIVNGRQKLHKSGIIPWMGYKFTANASGDYDFKWIYEKDPFSDENNDCVCLDDVSVIRYVPEYMPGDCEADGDVDILDAVMVLRYAIGIINEMPCIEAGDIDNDDKITVLDAVMIMRVVMGVNS